MSKTKESHSNDQNDPTENYNFVQVNRSYLKQMRGLTRKNPIASEILLFLVENMGKTSNAVVCSYHTLSEVTNTSRATVGRAIKILKDDNWVQAVKVGSATAYAVNARVFWQTSRNHKKYAIFAATVVAAESEQNSDFQEKCKHDLKHIPFIDPKDTVSINHDELPPPDQQELDLC